MASALLAEKLKKRAEKRRAASAEWRVWPISCHLHFLSERRRIYTVYKRKSRWEKIDLYAFKSWRMARSNRTSGRWLSLRRASVFSTRFRRRAEYGRMGEKAPLILSGRLRVFLERKLRCLFADVNVRVRPICGFCFRIWHLRIG